MICKNCGKEIPNDMINCPVCGKETGLVSKHEEVRSVEKDEGLIPNETITETSDAIVPENIESGSSERDNEIVLNDQDDELEVNVEHNESNEKELLDNADDTDESNELVLEESEDMAKAFAAFEKQMQQSDIQQEYSTDDDSEKEIENASVSTDESKMDAQEYEMPAEEGNNTKENRSPATTAMSKLFRRAERGQEENVATAGAVKADTIKAIIKWDLLILVVSLLLSQLGGIGIMLLLGVLAIAGLDFVMIQKDRIGNSGSEKPSITTNKNFALIAAIAILIAAVGSFVIAPANSAMRAINNDDTESAKTIINKKIDGHGIQEALFEKRVDNIYKNAVEDYKNEKIDDSEVKSVMHKLSDILGKDNIIGKKAESFIGSIDAFNQGKAFYDSKNYPDAMKMLSSVSKDYPKYEKAQEMIANSKDTYKKEMIASIGATNSLDKCEAALETLNEGLKVLPEDSEIELKKKEVSTAYLAIVDKEVKAALDVYDNEKANTIVSTAIKLVGDNETLSNLKKTIAENQPVSLYTLPIINEQNTEEVYQSIKDNFGNEYRECDAYTFRLYRFDKDGFVTYNTAGNYRRMKGVIAFETDAASDFGVDISIEDANGQSLLKKKITKNSDPITVDVPLDGTERVTIKASYFYAGEGYDFSSGGYVIIGNFKVYK